MTCSKNHPHAPQQSTNDQPEPPGRAVFFLRLARLAANPLVTSLSLHVATRPSQAAATIPAAAAAAVAFGPVVGQILQLAAAAASDDCPPGMDRAAARQTLEVGAGQ